MCLLIKPLNQSVLSKENRRHCIYPKEEGFNIGIGAYTVIETCKETKSRKAKLKVREAASTEHEAMKLKFVGSMLCHLWQDIPV